MKHLVLVIVLAAGLSFVGACGDDPEEPQAASGGGAGGASGAGGSGGGSPEFVGATCKAPSECFGELDGEVKGEVLCLDRVRGGYCTHLCETDADCCAVPGECKTGIKQVCSPFESTGQKMCFLSCEEGDIKDASSGTTDAELFCQQEASRDFRCRSSGGGKENRKVCVPGDCGVGAGCAADGDCSGGLGCNTTFSGGYCGARECTKNADCTGDARCVKHTDGGLYCLRGCEVASDCSFCRGSTTSSTCSEQVTFAEEGTTGKVCVPTGL